LCIAPDNYLKMFASSLNWCCLISPITQKIAFILPISNSWRRENLVFPFGSVMHCYSDQVWMGLTIKC
jgi:hypothetical protein